MVYHGTSVTEEIFVGPEDELDDVCCIEMTKAHDEPMFYVTACCNTDWVWKFKMDGESNYEMVKHTIIDAIFECDSMVALMSYLDEIFEEDFDDIIAYEKIGHNNYCCENCNHRGCLN